MKLDLSEIARSPGMHATQEVDEPCPEDLGLACASPVSGKVEISNTASLLLVEGEIATEVKLECSRCLTDFALPVETTIQEQFRLVKVGDAASVLPMDEEDASTEVIDNNVLNVGELIRQSLLLVLPIQPLCRPDCQGLCPTCGENLNVRKCACPPAEPESPFKALAGLLKEVESDTEA
ncbi:MAG TPA: DUF177 domain-containing protein [Armatimonadota bacterium]|nr:DUF177 domain-containing protein [Armatimonadota bacterium]